MTTISMIPASSLSLPQFAVVRSQPSEAAPALTFGKVLRAAGQFVLIAAVVTVGIALPFLCIRRAPAARPVSAS